MYTPIDDALSLKDYEGQKVSCTGQVSRTPWQHLGGFFPDYPYSEYFDVGDFQIIIYSKEKINCPGNVAVKGTVIRLDGPSKGPSKTGDGYHEFHIIVDEFGCVQP
ncbi:MAG: hypothetical protein JW904_14630 [Spirochaetales bacterium]|nr:hypothetical protein [Spirochaetales bacterium]